MALVLTLLLVLLLLLLLLPLLEGEGLILELNSSPCPAPHPPDRHLDLRKAASGLPVPSLVVSASSAESSGRYSESSPWTTVLVRPEDAAPHMSAGTPRSHGRLVSDGDKRSLVQGVVLARDCYGVVPRRRRQQLLAPEGLVASSLHAPRCVQKYLAGRRRRFPFAA